MGFTSIPIRYMIGVGVGRGVILVVVRERDEYV